ncbi:MAG: nucleotidyltransferase family protein [Lachnospiraceae bacterium]
MVLKDSIKTELENIAKEFGLEKLILFGSRATDTCWERSDIDLAANFNSSSEYLEFCDKVEEIPTLLMFDVVNLSSDMISLDLRKSIKDEGVLLYEKV